MERVFMEIDLGEVIVELRQQYANDLAQRLETEAIQAVVIKKLQAQLEPPPAPPDSDA